MNYKTYSGDYEILESATVFTYDLSSNVEINVVPNTEFQFKLIFEFLDDGKGQGLKKTVESDYVKFVCKNFADIGAGTNSPIDIATANGKEVSVHFWVYKLSGAIRKIEYTLFRER